MTQRVHIFSHTKSLDDANSNRQHSLPPPTFQPWPVYQDSTHRIYLCCNMILSMLQYKKNPATDPDLFIMAHINTQNASTVPSRQTHSIGQTDRPWHPKLLAVATLTAIFATVLVGTSQSSVVSAQSTTTDTDPPFEIADFSGVSFTLKSSRPSACSVYQQPGALWDSRTVGSSTVCLALSRSSGRISDATLLMAVPGHTGEFWARNTNHSYFKLIFDVGEVKHICVSFAPTQQTGSVNCVLARRGTLGYGFRDTAFSAGDVISNFELVTATDIVSLFTTAQRPLAFDHFSGYEMLANRNYSTGENSPLVRRWCGNTYSYGSNNRFMAPSLNHMCITPATSIENDAGSGEGLVQIGISSLARQIADNNPTPLSNSVTINFSFKLMSGVYILRSDTVTCGTTRQLGTGYVFECSTQVTAYADDSSIPWEEVVGIRMGTFSTAQPRQPNVKVVRLEVTQGVQDWNNSLTLIKNRKTVIRAFMETPRGTKRTMSANLIATKLVGTKETPQGSTMPLNPRNSVTVRANAASNRGDIDSSLNFMLPAGWINFDTGEKLRVDLQFKQGTTDFQCSATVGGKTIDRCRAEVMFTAVNPPPEIKIVGVPVIRNSVTENLMPTEMHLQNHMMKSLLSVVYLDTKFVFHDITPFTLPVNLSTVNSTLRTVRTAVEGSADDRTIYLGILPGAVSANPNYTGLAINGSVQIASWFNLGIDESGGINSFFDQSGGNRNVGSHELAHLLGQPHTGRDHDNDSSTALVGTCNEGDTEELDEGELSDTSKEYEFFRTVDVKGRSELRPVLGPLDNFENEVWGTDTRSVYKYYNESVRNRGFYKLLSVINPRLVFSFMSYCTPNDGKSQGKWMDAFHHQRLINDRLFSESDSESSAVASQEVSPNVSSEMFSGSVLLSSDSLATGVEFDPVFSWLRSPVTAGSGSYVLELRDASGVVIKSISFEAHEGIPTTSAGGTNVEPRDRRANFAFVVSDPPEYESFAVMKEGVELASVSLSQSAPTITLSGPSAGEPFNSGETIDVSWSGSDEDGDELTYRVFYSTDGGSTYRILSPNTDATSKSYPANLLEGSSQVRIGVSVSDGSRSAFAETPIFSVAGHAPEIWIDSPLSNSVFAEEQGFVLEAAGYDIEDGILTSPAFRWSSSIDGDLGAGEFVVLSAADLTPGSHTITATATDSDQMANSVSVNITISRHNTLPQANADTIAIFPGRSVFADVLANDLDIERDVTSDSFAFVQKPTLGTANITVSQQGITGILYTSSTKGIDTFSYQICDAPDRCSTAEVQVAVCTIIGTQGDDILTGTSGDDVICGLGGNDTIDGRAGNDIIDAGPGDDTVYGGAGDDTIYGRLGNDFILGHRGNDFIHGQLGDDIIYGGGGFDTIFGEDGADELYGEADNDVLRGGDGPDKIHGGRGDDAIFGGEGDDTIRGNAGTDIIYPGPGSNTVLGTSQDDTVIQDDT